MREKFRQCSACAVALFVVLAISWVYADDSPDHPLFLAHASVSILSSAGAHCNGPCTSDMVFASFGPDGWGWAGGAGGVMGSSALHNGTTNVIAANEVFRFNVGPIVDSLNLKYGAGNWTVANPKLTFTSSCLTSCGFIGNPRFGEGSGTFAIYWVANNNWDRSAGTPGDRQLNPVYATSKDDLAGWAGDLSLLGRESFSYQGIEYVPGFLVNAPTPYGLTSFINLAYELAPHRDFVDDILSASANGSHPTVTLYLMATDPDIGMIIYTGGRGQPFPTLSFDVVEEEGHSHHSE